MDTRRSATLSAWARSVLAASAMAAGFLALPHAAVAHGVWNAPLVTVEIYDRTSGSTLEVHAKDGQRYVVGTPGHEYALRIRNNDRGRVLVVTSVDGVNVVTGETASPDQSGYVVDAGGSVEIEGWRRSLERTAAFYFTDLGDSYAARTGRAANVGVIGAAAFRERRVPLTYEAPPAPIAGADSAARAPAPAAAEAARAGDARASGAPPSASKLGTGFGRDETSPARRVAFERASDAPAQTIAIRYDRRENLVAMGVLPSPRYAQRAPDPFPGMRFVPAPR